MLKEIFRRAVTLLVLSTLVFTLNGAQADTALLAPQHRIYESYPDHVETGIEAHQRQIARVPPHGNNAPFFIIVQKVNRWAPGSTVRVAFHNADPSKAALYDKIAMAASEWTKPNRANLDFQFKDTQGKYLSWSDTDVQFSAEIRISFNDVGYWSIVGTDSVGNVYDGGRPRDASMNLEGFDKELPSDWRAIVMHEFGHALGFEHEHQNPAGGCDFRFEDDPGYQQTTDAQGWITVDSAGKRPGLYTYLGGYANYWPKEKVDSNLKALPNSSAYLVGQFDRSSIMKYFFDPSMFTLGVNSPCYTPTENLEISDQDAEGARIAYQSSPAAAAVAQAQIREAFKTILSSVDVPASVKLHYSNIKKV